MFSSFDPIDVFILLFGVAFLLKKLAETDRYHSLGVVLLTTFLSCIVIYLFAVYCSPPSNSCVPDPCVDGQFCAMY